MKVKVIPLPYIFQVLYVLCFTRPRNQVSVYRAIGPLVYKTSFAGVCTAAFTYYYDPVILQNKLTPLSIFRDLALRKRD